MTVMRAVKLKPTPRTRRVERAVDGVGDGLPIDIHFVGSGEVGAAAGHVQGHVF